MEDARPESLVAELLEPLVDALLRGTLELADLVENGLCLLLACRRERERRRVDRVQLDLCARVTTRSAETPRLS